MKKRATIDCVEASAYKIPTEKPESDGTYSWDATTLVVVHLSGGGRRDWVTPMPMPQPPA